MQKPRAHTLFIWRLHSYIKHYVFFLPPLCHGCTTNVISFSVKRCIAGLCNKPFFSLANLTWLHLLLVLNPSKQALQNAEGTSMQLNTASFITALKGHFFMPVQPSCIFRLESNSLLMPSLRGRRNRMLAWPEWIPAWMFGQRETRSWPLLSHTERTLLLLTFAHISLWFLCLRLWPSFEISSRQMKW